MATLRLDRHHRCFSTTSVPGEAALALRMNGRSLYLLERLTGWAIPKARACSVPRADRFQRHLSCSKLGAYGPRRRGAYGRGCCGQMERRIFAEGKEERGLMSVVTHGNKHNSIIRLPTPFRPHYPPFSLPPLPYRPCSLGKQNYRIK